MNSSRRILTGRLSFAVYGLRCPFEKSKERFVVSARVILATLRRRGFAIRDESNHPIAGAIAMNEHEYAPLGAETEQVDSL